MPWYLGQPGALVQLPAPSRGTQVPFAALGATHQLLSGGQVLDRFAVKRSWQFSWQALTRDQVGVLDAFAYGAIGPGPYVLLDPEQRNLLPLNVSTGTDTTKDTTGVTAGPGAVSSSTNANTNFNALGGPFPANGTRTLAGGVLVGAANGTVIWTSAVKQPVIVGQIYTASAYVSLDATAQAAGLQVNIQVNWYDANLASLGHNRSGTVTTTGRSVVSAAAPAGAVWAEVQLPTANAYTGGSAAGTYSDGLQFEQASSVSAWVPGLGVPNVIVAPGGGRTRQQTNWNDYTLTVVEV